MLRYVVILYHYGKTCTARDFQGISAYVGDYLFRENFKEIIRIND